jgi:phosphoribosylglycinamide formyltransferase-1
MLNIAVFASGRGSNFQAIVDAIESGRIRQAKIVVVISNNSDAGSLAIARDHGIPARHVSQRQFRTESEYVAELQNILHGAGVNFIVLAGYMKKIDPGIVGKFRNRIINVHPGLLPEFGGPGMYGMHVHEAVLARKASVSGATVHVVDEEYDRGPVILQRTVDVTDGDTPETLAAKVLRVEHEIYPEAVRLFAEGKIRIDGRHVTIAAA